MRPNTLKTVNHSDTAVIGAMQVPRTSRPFHSKATSRERAGMAGRCWEEGPRIQSVHLP